MLHVSLTKLEEVSGLLLHVGAVGLPPWARIPTSILPPSSNRHSVTPEPKTQLAC